MNLVLEQQRFARKNGTTHDQVAQSRFSLLLLLRPFLFYLDIQTPFAPFVHLKLPLAARLGHSRGARPSRLPFPASRQNPFPKLILFAWLAYFAVPI
jgi:hypothetical protein